MTGTSSEDADGMPSTGTAGRALVVVASTRAAAGTYEDRSGPVLVDGLRAMGFAVDGPVVVVGGAAVSVGGVTGHPRPGHGRARRSRRRSC